MAVAKKKAAKKAAPKRKTAKRAASKRKVAKKAVQHDAAHPAPAAGKKRMAVKKASK